MKRLVFLTMLFFAAITGCRKDSEITEISETDPPFPKVYVKTTISGRVVDENLNGVKGATVVLEGKTFTTDQNGVFQFKNILTNSKAAYVRVEHPGFFHGSRTLIVSGGTRNSVLIQILSNQSTQFISASSGGTADFTDFSIGLPAGGIVDEKTGKDFVGEVGIAAKWLDPTDENFTIQMPGRLEGVQTDGSITGMVSMGMLAVELKSASGQKLQIKPGFEAKLKMKVPAAILGKAPATIPLWYFDEENGYWKEEGEAKLVGNVYEGTVKHFSFWNCDSFIGTVERCYKIVDGSGNPIANAFLRFKVLSSGFQGGGWTDNTGTACGEMPKGELLELQVFPPFDGCKDPILTQQIGPYTQNGIETFTINLSNLQTYTITGTLKDCAGNGILNGYVKIEGSDEVGFVANDGSGNFEIELIRCTPITSVTLLGYDFGNIKVSLPKVVDVSSGTANTGNIEVCDALATYFFYNFSGKSIFSPNPQCFSSDSMPGGPLDFIQIQISDSLYVSFWLENVAGVGVYQSTWFQTEGQFQGQNVYHNCQNGSGNCITVTITEFSGPDNFIAGTFTGTVADLGAGQQPAPTLNITGSFRGVLK